MATPPSAQSPPEPVRERIERIVREIIHEPAEREQHTEPLLPVPVAPPIVNVTVERPVAPPSQEQRYVPAAPTTWPERERAPAPRAPERERVASVSPHTTQPEREQNKPVEPNKKSSPDRIESIPDTNKNNSPSELLEPSEPAPQADLSDFKKIGKVGRQRKYEALGIDDIEPIRELILFRHQFGRHWPGLSADMQSYYEKMYFSKPKRGSKDAKHAKCYARGRAWINPPSAPTTQST